MAALSSNVALSFGVISCTVSVYGAIAPRPSNIRVVQAEDGTLLRTGQQITAGGEPLGDRVVHTAREVPGGAVILTDDDLSTAGADAEPYKKAMALSAHPAADVETGTAPGEKAYHLVPAKGHAANYRLLMQLIGAHPELAFLTKFTPRKNMMAARVVVKDGVLLAQERISGEAYKTAPTIDPAEVSEQLLNVAEQVLLMPGQITPFDLAAYSGVDPAASLAAIIEGREVLALAGGSSSSSGAAPAPAVDALALLQAQLDANKPAPRKRAPRKPKPEAA